MSLPASARIAPVVALALLAGRPAELPAQGPAAPAAGAATPAASAATDATDAQDTPRQRRKELDDIADELRHRVVLVREDLIAAGPAPRSGRATELLDGSYYAHADSAIVFEALSPARVVDARLRDGGKVLLLRLVAPSDLRPRGLRGDGRNIATPLLVEVDVDQRGGVRAAVGAVVFLPGESPTEEEVLRCLRRYPEHDERTSRMRCGVARDDG